MKKVSWIMVGLLLITTLCFAAPEFALAPGTSVISGKTSVTTVGTAVVLGNNNIISVTIKAEHANSHLVYVGDSAVSSSNGFELSAGDAISIDTDNLSDIYIATDTAGNGVSYLGLVRISR